MLMFSVVRRGFKTVSTIDILISRAVPYCSGFAVAVKLDFKKLLDPTNLSVAHQVTTLRAATSTNSRLASQTCYQSANLF